LSPSAKILFNRISSIKCSKEISSSKKAGSFTPPARKTLARRKSQLSTMQIRAAGERGGGEKHPTASFGRNHGQDPARERITTASEDIDGSWSFFHKQVTKALPVEERSQNRGFAYRKKRETRSTSKKSKFSSGPSWAKQCSKAWHIIAGGGKPVPPGLIIGEEMRVQKPAKGSALRGEIAGNRHGHEKRHHVGEIHGLRNGKAGTQVGSVEAAA